MCPEVSAGVLGSGLWSPGLGFFFFKHTQARAWSEMNPGPQTGACGKMRLVHVGVNPGSLCALCAPTSHDENIFTRKACGFVRGVFAGALYIVCAVRVLLHSCVWSLGLVASVRCPRY